ncbi:MAG: hypothetical protein JXX14_26440 [Deltaproteobacteria bacterium]|nr:hypothetical protein [Deltaproteobacteria bacterium]
MPHIIVISKYLMFICNSFTLKETGSNAAICVFRALRATKHNAVLRECHVSQMIETSTPVAIGRYDFLEFVTGARAYAFHEAVFFNFWLVLVRLDYQEGAGGDAHGHSVVERQNR